MFDSAKDNKGFVSFKILEAKLKKVNYTEDFVEDLNESEDEDENVDEYDLWCIFYYKFKI